MPPYHLEWIEISDFTPGIVSRVNLTGHRYTPTSQPGIAAATNTYRCMALESGGGLGPLWSQDLDLAYGTLPESSGVTNYYLTGFHIETPLNAGSNTLRDHALLFGVEYLYDTATDERRWLLRRYKSYLETPAFHTLATQSTTTQNTLNQYHNTKFTTTRTNRASTAEPGIPVTIFAWHVPGPNNPSKIYQFPDDSNSESDTPATLYSNLYYPSHLIAHQGRVVILDVVNYDHGSDSAWYCNENLRWTTVNDTDTIASGSNAQVFSWENPTGYGVGASMSANELFLVKRRGGAITLNGDLNDPTVINLPNVASSMPCVGTMSPVGYIYLGSSGGVYAWGGGDTSTHISRQLEDFCWLVADANIPFLDYKAVLTIVGTDYIILPRMWTYNVHTNSWWRLDSESDTSDQLWAFQTGQSAAMEGPFIYGAVGKFDASDDTIIYGWDTSIPASSYSWQSQPLFASLDRELDARSIVLRAQGTGTVTITVTGRGGSTDSAAFTLSSDTEPVVIRKDIKLKANNLIIRIESEHTSTGAAPVVYSVSIGHTQDARVPN